MRFRLAIGLLGVVGLTACATSASQKALLAEQSARAKERDEEYIARDRARRQAEAAIVVTASPDQVKGCKSLGVVEGWQAAEGIKFVAVDRHGDTVLALNYSTHAENADSTADKVAAAIFASRFKNPEHKTVDVPNGPVGEIYNCAGVR